MMKFGAIAAAFLIAGTGCSTRRISDPPRTASEQLLITIAAERASAGVDLGLAPGTKVVIRDQFLDGADKAYTSSFLRDYLLRHGCKVVPDATTAQALVELRASSLSIDRKEFLIGIPAIPVPLPYAGALSTPEIALFKRLEQHGIARLASTAWTPAEGMHLASAGPTFGDTFQVDWTVFFFFSWTDRDYDYPSK